MFYKKYQEPKNKSMFYILVEDLLDIYTRDPRIISPQLHIDLNLLINKLTCKQQFNRDFVMTVIISNQRASVE